MSRYAVIGNPVSHSKSPLIHQLFAAQSGIQLDYSAIEVAADNFDNFVEKFFQDGGAGLNVTVPFKESAFKLVQECSSRAQVARAVNTLYINSSQQLCGDNTDGIGLLTDLKANCGIQLTGKNILILGAGGAVRGILGMLIKELPGSITLLNRTLARAHALQQDFAKIANIDVHDYSSSVNKQFDLIINATSAGLVSELPPVHASMIGPDCVCYDMVYGDKAAAFVLWARKHGAKVAVDGLGMLVEQAAESFYIWHGVKPQTAPVIAALRKS